MAALFVPGTAEQFNNILREWQVGLARAFEQQQATIDKEQAGRAEENTRRQAIDKVQSDEASKLIGMATKWTASIRMADGQDDCRAPDKVSACLGVTKGNRHSIKSP